MHIYDYKKFSELLVNSKTINLVALIYELKGKLENIFNNSKLDLTILERQTLIENVIASNQIENIFVNKNRSKKILSKNQKPINDNEWQVLSYKYTLEFVNNSYSNLTIDVKEILKLHQMLYQYLLMVKLNPHFLAKLIPHPQVSVEFIKWGFL